MKFWALLNLGAVLPFLFTSALPSTVALLCLLLIALMALMLPTRRLYFLAPACFLLATLTINERIAQRWPLLQSKSIYQVSGIISSLPQVNEDAVRFMFLPDEVGIMDLSMLQVQWFRDRRQVGTDVNTIPPLHAGERWQLTLELRPPRGRVNFNGFDSERWYFAQGLDALAYVQEGDNVLLKKPSRFDLQHWRELLLEKLVEKGGDVPAFRVLVALAIADRRGLSADDKDILSATGTGHLLAISGLHVGLAAIMGFYLGRLVLLCLSFSMKQRAAIVLPWLSAWFAALAYSALSGFGVSTQRALIMLSVATLVMLSRRNVSPLLAWLIAMALVLLVDPFAPLRAGFWFSFVAVAVLMMLFAPRYGALPVWRKMLLAQFGISLVMAPLGMFWFQQASLPGLVANLVAIPVVSMLIVPLVLLSLPLLFMPGPLAGWLLSIAGQVADWLFYFLEILSTFQPTTLALTQAPGLTVTIVAMLGAVMLLMPVGTPGRYAGLLLMLPLVFPNLSLTDRKEIRVDFLDVGQGLAVLIETGDYLLLYDTGPGNGKSDDTAWDMVRGTLQPMIRATGQRPDLIIASHADLDHAGGLNNLQYEYPDTRFLASLPRKRSGIQPCQLPASWQVDDVTFTVLHPSIGLPYLGNDSSCVLGIKSKELSILLSGDISKLVEQRLVDTGLGRYDILSAPHHGSSTSSSQYLIDTVRPAWVLVSAAMNNRFGFPREDVLGRYAAAGIPVLNTAQCGGIRVTGGVDRGISLQSARVQRKAIWRWSANPLCP